MTDSWHSYPNVYALGHRAVAEILLDEVLVEEKVDGSQFSWCRVAGGDYGDVRCRSKGAEIQVLAPDKMFAQAVRWVLENSLRFHEGWTYRAEYLMKPKHNALAYDRIPANHLLLFDVNTAHETYLPWEEKAGEAARLGLEVAPRMYQGVITDVTMVRDLLTTRSCLGGQNVEGLVIKNYARYGLDKKVLLAKFVSEAFKEVHAREWKSANPNAGDVVQQLGDALRTPARWQKALQHLRDAGQIEDSPRDIGLLMREVWPDIEKECEGEIRDKLYAWAAPKLRRMVTAGLPEWYKEQLLALQFEREPRDKTGIDDGR